MVSDNKFFNNYNLFNIFILFIISICITITHFNSNNKNNKLIRDIFTWSPWILLFIYMFVYYFIQSKINYSPTFVLIIFGILASSYTIAQWELSDFKESKCNWLIPSSNNYDSKEYTIYRLLYFISLIVLTVLLLIRLNENGNSNPTYWYYIMILLPIILPFFTEFINSITQYLHNDINDADKINPESLLMNFIYGNDSENIDILHTIFSIIFYIFLISLVIIYTLGLTGTKSNIPLIIISIILSCFSFIMRFIFIQNCSLSNDINVNESNNIKCKIEKYGGIQVLFCISLICIILNGTPNHRDKLLLFLIMLSLIWGLSMSFINILKK